jgi:hypothetical protein
MKDGKGSSAGGTPFMARQINSLWRPCQGHTHAATTFELLPIKALEAASRVLLKVEFRTWNDPRAAVDFFRPSFHKLHSSNDQASSPREGRDLKVAGFGADARPGDVI